MVGGGEMSLICMCVYDTDENGRSEYTERTLENLFWAVDWSKHRMVMIDNGSNSVTKQILSGHELKGIRDIITNETNLGTAKAINQGIILRKPNEYVIKIDNDVVINQSGWVDQLEEAIERDPTIGICGLKRKDVDWDGQYIPLPHTPGQTWVTVEKGTYIMGTVTMFNYKLLDDLGGFQDCAVYGFDDTLISLRSELSGYWNCYLPHIEIEHLDRGDNPYIHEKHRISSEAWEKYKEMHEGYINGSLPLRVEI